MLEEQHECCLGEIKESTFYERGLQITRSLCFFFLFFFLGGGVIFPVSWNFLEVVNF